MLARSLLLARLLLTGFVALGPVTTASATHSCGIDVPCPHPSDPFCLFKDNKYLGPIIEKYNPCPY